MRVCLASLVRNMLQNTITRLDLFTRKTMAFSIHVTDLDFNNEPMQSIRRYSMPYKLDMRDIYFNSSLVSGEMSQGLREFRISLEIESEKTARSSG